MMSMMDLWATKGYIVDFIAQFLTVIWMFLSPNLQEIVQVGNMAFSLYHMDTEDPGQGHIYEWPLSLQLYF